MKYFKNTISFSDRTKTLIARVDDDGEVWWLGLGENDPLYLEWISCGNTAEEWTDV